MAVAAEVTRLDECHAEPHTPASSPRLLREPVAVAAEVTRLVECHAETHTPASSRRLLREPVAAAAEVTRLDEPHAEPQSPASSRRLLRWAAAAAGLLVLPLPAAEQRFPPPEFETGHKLPITTTPEPRALALEWFDAGLLIVALGIATWLVYRQRSRRGLVALSIASLAYFGFYRNGCVCAIGSVQNVALGIFDSSYAIPVTVLIFFLAPLVFALFAGRVFCAGVCPHGALQDLVLIKPVKVPAWLENSLGLIPFVFLGAGVIFAATGSAFLICRYDPFVPLFRLTGSLPLLTLGAAFVITGMFVGRPYCRFLCPYGALLRVGSLVSQWRVRVTPDFCTQCKLCEHACPYGAMREPVVAAPKPEPVAWQRKRLTWLLLALPVLVAAGALAGAKLGPAAARLHPTVALAELHAGQQVKPVTYPAMSPDALALERAANDPETIATSARDIRRRVTFASWLFGGWIGLVIGIKLIALSVRTARTDYEPDRGACVACARCFEYCPNERVRRGLLPATALETPARAKAPAPAPVPAGAERT